MSTEIYRFTCVCGQVIDTPETIGQCWDCERKFELHWRAEYVGSVDTKVVEEKSA